MLQSQIAFAAFQIGQAELTVEELIGIHDQIEIAQVLTLIVNYRLILVVDATLGDGTASTNLTRLIGYMQCLVGVYRRL